VIGYSFESEPIKEQEWETWTGFRGLQGAMGTAGEDRWECGKLESGKPE
jgi:hypothetical protein